MNRTFAKLLSCLSLGAAGAVFCCGMGTRPAESATAAPAVRPVSPRPAVSPVLAAEADAALAKSAGFLLGKQLPDGSWLKNPAITALNCLSLTVAPGAKEGKIREAINRGLDFVVRNAQPDGSIFNKENEEYPNYSTAISTIALALINRPQDQNVLRAARNFLLNSQFKDLASSDPSYGGIGYGKAKRPDLSNTQWAMEALYLTDKLDREPLSKDAEKAKQADLAWERAIAFLSRCQNLKETNTQTWVASDPDNRGGFVYMPGDSKAGAVSEDGGALRSYGSMTYAGFKSMIYAGLSRDDVRVKAAREWFLRHYSFDENPGMKDAGLFYYLHTCAKALAANGEERLVLPDGSTRSWREDFIRSLVAKQKPTGEWVNANGRWMENLPELSTAYSAMALGIALDRLPSFAPPAK